MSTVKENLIAAKKNIESGATAHMAVFNATKHGDLVRETCAVVSACVPSSHIGRPAVWKYISYSEDADTTVDDLLALFDRAIAAQDGNP